MTIYSTKGCEKKKADEASVTNCVSSENQTNLEKEDATVRKLVPSSAHISSIINKRGKRLVKICVASAVLVILICGIILGIVIYNTGLDKIFHGWCDVHYYEYKKEGHSTSTSSQNYENGRSSGQRFYQRRIDGSFRQEVVIDLDYGIFEKIEVPRIGESRKATIIHDFGKNLTAIADQEHSQCFVLPLSRSHVKPPRDLFDLLNKMKMGFYFYDMPEAEVVREMYRAITPPVQRMTPFGYNIWKECHTCDTFLLTKEADPQTIKKRHACELAGNQYCLGDGGTDQMLCIKIKGCL